MNLQLLTLALAFCAASATAEVAPTPLQVVSSSSNSFSANLYDVLSSSNRGKNLVCSPMSAFIALAMVERGASGRTAELMRRTLYLPNNSAVTNAGFRSLIDDFNSVKQVDLSVANKIFVSTMLNVKNSYLTLTKEVFRSEAEYMNVQNPVGVAKSVNSWVEDKTRNKIRNILSPEDVNNMTRMILVNAIYFKGKWANAFKKEATQHLEFFKTKDVRVKVPTMNTRGSFAYGRLQGLNAQYIRLPYENKELEMVIVVPDEEDGLSEIEGALKSYNYNTLTSFKTTVNLFLPKFKIESSINLEEPLRKIGMGEIFKAPDFSGIARGNYAISKVKQKAFIEVNEEGSEAAAATVGFIPEPVTLRVDRPFYFLIRKGQTVIFQGHVYNPTK